MAPLALFPRFQEITPWRQLPRRPSPTENTPGDNPPPPRLGALSLTNPQRGVLTLTLTLTDPWGGNYLKTDTNLYF